MSRRLFDLWSRVYDLPLVQRATYEPVHDAILRALGKTAHERSRILDVGCGTGRLAARIRAQMPAAEVIGVDFSRGMLREAVGRLPDGHWVRGDACSLPFASRSFDAVVSSEAFHWFPDQPGALAEIFRVLAPCGMLLVALVHTPWAALGEALHAGSQAVGAPFRWPTDAEMSRMVVECGFRDVRQHRVFRIPAGMLLPPVLTEGMRPGAA